MSVSTPQATESREMEAALRTKPIKRDTGVVDHDIDPSWMLFLQELGELLDALRLADI